MIKSKKNKLISAVLALSLSVTTFTGGALEAFAADGDPLAVAGTAKWETKLGSGGYNSTSPVTYSDGKLYCFGSGNINRIDADTGEVEATASAGGTTTYYTIAPAIDDTNIVLGLNNASVAIIDKATLEKKEIVKYAETSAQTISPICIRNGYAYVGSSELIYNETTGRKTDNTGTFAKINLTDYKVTKIIDTAADGNNAFYWAGMCESSDGQYGVVGTSSDINTSEMNPETGTARIYAINLNNDATSYAEVEGSISTTPVEYNGAFYFSTKAGKLYKAVINEGQITAEVQAAIGGPSTGTAVIDGDKFYAGYSKGVFEYDLNTGAKKTYTSPADVKGFAVYKGNILCTYNAKPGGIYNATYKYTLYKPAEENQNYCISPVTIVNDTLYYNNDSGCHFALQLEPMTTKFANSLTSTVGSTTKAYGAAKFSLGAKAKTSIKYSSSSTSVATVSTDGYVTIKGTGKTTITMSAAETAIYKPAKKTITLTVVPKKTANFSVTPGSKKMTVKWSKDSKASGYQIVYAANSKFTSGKKTVTVSGYSNSSKTISKLTKGKYYYVKMRSYKTINGSKYYGAYTTYKKIKVK